MPKNSYWTWVFFSIVAFALINASIALGQTKSEYEDDVLKCLKTFDIDKTVLKLNDMSAGYSKEILNKELSFLKTGLAVYPSAPYKTKTNSRDSIFYYWALGNYFSRKTTPVNNLAYENYAKALKKAHDEKDTILINKCLIGINRVVKQINIPIYKEIYRDNIASLKLFAKDSIDWYWTYHHSLVYQIKYATPKERDKIFIEFEKYIQPLIEITPNEPTFLGKTYFTIGQWYSIPNDFEKAKSYWNRALEVLKDDYYHTFLDRKKVLLAFLIVANREGYYKKSKKSLIDALNDSVFKYDYYSKKFIYENIIKAYRALKINDSALYYIDKSKTNDSILKNINKEEVKFEIHSKYQAKLKEETNQQLVKSNKLLQQNLNTILPILGIVVVVSIVIFYLYRRYRKKSTVLEEEKSETLQKLDELKQIVIKNHIILKDKTKVYITDLMYIKADDHYLNLFLSNGKDHFVRGKLKNIKEELPPNFIQCHRSYIVNANFIEKNYGSTLFLYNKTQIPVSRSFKDKF